MIYRLESFVLYLEQVFVFLSVYCMPVKFLVNPSKGLVDNNGKSIPVPFPQSPSFAIYE